MLAEGQVSLTRSRTGFKVVSKGVYQRDELVRYLVEEPAKYPGCSGTRCLSDVESDLRAQIAANKKVRSPRSERHARADTNRPRRESVSSTR